MYRHILVAVAPDHTNPIEQSLAVAERLLLKDGSVTFLTVVEDIPSFAEAYIPEGTLEANEQQARKRVNSLAETVNFPCRAALMHGRAAPVILTYADDNDVDCIIVASHQPGLEDYFIGSTAARVVRHAACSVHVVR